MVVFGAKHNIFLEKKKLDLSGERTEWTLRFNIKQNKTKQNSHAKWESNESITRTHGRPQL